MIRQPHYPNTDQLDTEENTMTTTTTSTERRNRTILGALLAATLAFSGAQIAAGADAEAADPVKGFVVHERYSMRSGLLVKCSNGKNYSVKRTQSSVAAGCRDVDAIYTPTGCYSSLGGQPGTWMSIGNRQTAYVNLAGKSCKV